MSKEYRKVAKKLGVIYLFGRWGLNRPKQGLVSRWWVSIIPLDGWLLDPDEVAKEMEKRDYEL